MLKFIKGKEYQPNAERLKLQKELFQFSKTIAQGFPHRPSALAWDPKLKLTAIGTRNGQIRVYGNPGVELSNQHENEAAVTHIQFLENQGRLITLLDDSTLHLWQIDVKNDQFVLIEVKELELEKQLQKVSATCVRSNNEQLWLGTESGNIYTVDVLNLKVLEEKLIFQDVVMQSVPDDFNVNPGAVEAISQHPADSDKILIGYNRGLIVLWDCAKMAVESTFVGNQQQLESISWNRNGKSFISAHNDGSYITWDVSDPSKPKEKPQRPCGPFPCKSITKLVLNAGKDGDDFIVFTGGMPRASYGDRHTLSIIAGEKHKVLDFTSKVVDFFTIDDDELGSSKALIALAEEEIVAIDLLSEEFPQFRFSYQSSLHPSAITCSQHCGDVPEELWNKIVEARKKQDLRKEMDMLTVNLEGMGLEFQQKKPNLKRIKKRRSLSVDSGLATEKKELSLEEKYPLLQKPFEYGFRREIVDRNVIGKNLADLYYWSPKKNGQESKRLKEAAMREYESQLLTSAFYYMGAQLQRKTAEERMRQISPQPQTFLSRQLTNV